LAEARLDLQVQGSSRRIRKLRGFPFTYCPLVVLKTPTAVVTHAHDFAKGYITCNTTALLRCFESSRCWILRARYSI